MKRISMTAVAGLALAGVVAAAPAAHATTVNTETIRPGDFVQALGDTRSAGHVDFLKEGLHVHTDDATSNAKAAEYFSVPTQGIPGSASLTWWGTQPQPGSQILFDLDSDRSNDNTYNVLVGEPVYGDDYWYTGGQARAALRGFTCPETTGGSGSDCHGTLEQWQNALPQAEVYAAGFSLGSGVKGDGVLHDIQVGDTDYQFTNEPAAPVVTKVAVTGTARVARTDHRAGSVLRVHFTTDRLGANQVQGKRLHFKVTDNGRVVYRSTMNAGAAAHVTLRFAQGSGKHKVQVLKNGVVDQHVVIKTGR